LVTGDDYPDFGVPLAKESGYIQSVNNAALLRLARDRKTIVWMEHGIGEFVVRNTALAERTVESAHDRARIDTRLARVRETLETEPALCPGEEKQ
jgi:uncharacterized membrane protein